MLGMIYCLISLLKSSDFGKESYGVDLELLEFQTLQDDVGFAASFALHVDVNYIFFGLMRKGDKYNHDRMMSRLNTEYSMNSSQKKGSTFTVKKQFKMYNMLSGTYYFQLESLDGNIYKSNQFSQNQHGMWMIKRSSGLSNATSPDKVTWIEKYKYCIMGASAVLIGCLVFLGIKAYRK